MREAVHDAIERIVFNGLHGLDAWRFGLTKRLTNAALSVGSEPDWDRLARAIDAHIAKDHPTHHVAGHCVETCSTSSGEFSSIKAEYDRIEGGE